MKKFVRITLLVSACLLAVGILTGALGFVWTWRTADRFTPEAPVEQDLALDMETLEALDMDISLGDVRLLPLAEGEQARLEMRGYAQGEIVAAQDGGTLTVSTPGGIGRGSLVDFGIFRIDLMGKLHVGSLAPRSVTLYLPETELQRVDIDVNVGRLENAVPLRAETLSLASSVGDLALRDLTATTLELATDVGGIDVEDFSCETLSAQAETGDLALRDGAAAGSAVVSVNIGDATLREVELTNLTLTAEIGDTLLEGALHGPCALETDNGDLTLRLAGGAARYALEFHAELGDVTVRGAELYWREGAGVVNPELETADTVRVTSSLGDVTVDLT